MVLVACLHGAKEQWWRLNWVCDVAEFVANTTGAPIDWQTVIERARSQGCLRALMVGVGLANRVLGVELAPDLKDEIAADWRIEPLLDLITAQRENPYHLGPPEPLKKLTRLRFEIHEGARRKILYTARTLFAPRPAHIKMLALLPRGHFLYFFARAIHDYFLLPCWRLWQRRPLSRGR